MATSQQRLRSSSYQRPLDYSELFRMLSFTKAPKHIVEFGILDGFSLKNLAEVARPDAKIKAYDIFEEFNASFRMDRRITFF